MSDWPKDGCPPQPGDVAGERGIVPAGAPRGGGVRPLSVSGGLVLCAIGGAAASTTLSMIASALVAYGFIAASESGSPKARLAAVAASVLPAVALAAPMGAFAALAAALCCLVALVVAEAVRRSALTPGAACVVVGASALAHLGVDAAAAAASGTTVWAGIEEMLDLYQQQLDGFATGVAMQGVREVMGVMWPLAYVLTALGEYLFALLGVGLASPRTTERHVRLPRLVDYDLPLWVVSVLVASVAGIAFGLTVTGGVGDSVLMVSANVALALRFAFMAQGLAVVTWLVRSHHVGPLASGLLGAAALFLEVQFFVMTIAGLVDVWANFRHLDRGGRLGGRATAE